MAAGDGPPPAAPNQAAGGNLVVAAQRAPANLAGGALNTNGGALNVNGGARMSPALGAAQGAAQGAGQGVAQGAAQGAAANLGAHALNVNGAPGVRRPAPAHPIFDINEGLKGGPLRKSTAGPYFRVK